MRGDGDIVTPRSYSAQKFFLFSVSHDCWSSSSSPIVSSTCRGRKVLANFSVGLFLYLFIMVNWIQISIKKSEIPFTAQVRPSTPTQPILEHPRAWLLLWILLYTLALPSHECQRRGSTHRWESVSQVCTWVPGSFTYSFGINQTKQWQNQEQSPGSPNSEACSHPVLDFLSILLVFL
jgi:hypothetical protein